MSNNNIVFILGAGDPEMEMIIKLLNIYAVPFCFAEKDGKRVHPGNAYGCDPVERAFEDQKQVWVECSPAEGHDGFVIDHHRPGDPGYGKPPSDAFRASSIGQTFNYLQSATTDWADRLEVLIADPAFVKELYIAAAADHCLAAAYAGECPNVSPSELQEWRYKTRAAFQRRDVNDIAIAVGKAKDAIRSVQQRNQTIVLNIDSNEPELAVDMRGRFIPELPEAAAQLGVCFISDSARTPDGRQKVGCLSGTAEQIEAFMTSWAPSNGLFDIYGDPARGYAGGYVA